MSEIDENGLRFQADINAGEYEYPTETLNSANTRLTTANFKGGSAAFGYEMFFKRSRLAAYVGVAARNTSLSPDTFFSDARGENTGVKLQLEGDYNLSERYVASTIATYTGISDNFWTRSRLGYKCDKTNIHFGPEVVVHGDNDYDYRAGGLYVADIPFFTTPINVEATAKAEQVNGQGIYGTFGVGFSSPF